MGKSIYKFRLIFLIIALITTIISIRIYYALTDDFRLSNITYDMPIHAEWKIPPSTDKEELDLHKILDQPFTYLGKGAQSYVFASADGKYVLKFFKFKHLRPSLLIEMLPNVGFLKSFKEKQTQRKDRKLNGVFQSHILAFNQLRQASGLVFIQMNSKDNPERSVVIFDKLGMRHVIPLAQYPFILQKRGVTLHSVLDAHLNKGNVLKAKSTIDSIFALYASEYAKGLYDHDHGVDRNTGFIDGKAAHLDVGKILSNEGMKDPTIAYQDAILVGDKIKEWVDKHHKIYLKVLSKHIDRTIEMYILSNEHKNDQ